MPLQTDCARANRLIVQEMADRIYSEMIPWIIKDVFKKQLARAMSGIFDHARLPECRGIATTMEMLHSMNQSSKLNITRLANCYITMLTVNMELT